MRFSQAIALSASLAIASTLSGCGSSSGGTSYALNGANYLVVGSGSLEHGSTQVSGSGSIVFNSPLSGIQSGNGYTLKFTLQDGGKLSLVMNANTQLQEGVTFEFTRSGGTLSAALKAGGQETDASAKFTGIDASGEVSLFIDGHNDESPMHVLAWTGDTEIFNSEDPGFEAPGAGLGQYWGLTLQNATVSTASVGAARFED